MFPGVVWVSAVIGLVTLFDSAMWSQLTESTPIEFGELDHPEASLARFLAAVAVTIGLPLVVALFAWPRLGLGGSRKPLLGGVITSGVLAYGNVAVMVSLVSSCHGSGSGAFPNPQAALAINLLASATVYGAGVALSLRSGRPRWGLWPVAAAVAVATGVVLSLVIVGAGDCDWDI
jgi:hypothetical protein